jgi:uncharacterized Fe-S cluster protein YjdI
MTKFKKMEKKNIIKEYSNGDLTIVWQPAKCIHDGTCVRTLPKVYDPNAKPWINIKNASTDALKEQIGQCPSGALSFYLNDEKGEETPVEMTKVSVRKNGPLLVKGAVEVTDADGNVEVKDKICAFCRCGISKEKPYCDGSHKHITFDD